MLFKFVEPLESRLLCAASLSGALKKWQPVTLDFAGPAAREADVSPNPFKDYRLQVMFTAPSGKTFSVPGYFNGDGAGGSLGTVWETKFTPDEKGTWSYRASFRKGTNVAIDLTGSAGTSTSFNGTTGSFSI